MKSKINLSILTVLATLSFTSNSAFAGGGPHEHPTCRPGQVTETAPHTAYESYVLVDLGLSSQGIFSALSIYAKFEGRKTSVAGPGCVTKIVNPGIASVHLGFQEVGPNYQMITKEDFTTSSGVTVEPIIEHATHRVIGVNYNNQARQEKLDAICNVEYGTGRSGSTNVPGKADGIINGVTYNNADINCRSIAWTNTLP